MKNEQEIRTAIDALICEIEIGSNSPPRTLEEANILGMYTALRWAVGEGPAGEAFAELMRKYPADKFQVLRGSDNDPVVIQVNHG